MVVDDSQILRFSCPRCGQDCEADLHSECARQYRCPTCQSLLQIPDLLDFALTDGDPEKIQTV